MHTEKAGLKKPSLEEISARPKGIHGRTPVWDTDLDLSIVIPCLNEVETIATCIKKAQQALVKLSSLITEVPTALEISRLCLEYA